MVFPLSRADSPLSRLVEYQHSDIYQRMLREALNVAHEQGVSDHRISLELQRLDLSIDRTSITRFRERKTEFIKNKEVAKEIWNFLRGKGIISIEFLNKHSFSSEADFATHVNLFFETHESQFQDFELREFSGIFFGYKRSLRRRDSILKSLFLIRPNRAGYLAIREYQISQPPREADDTASLEESVGIGFSKSARIWLFMKEKHFQQPRIFVFGQIKEHPETRVTNVAYGHCLESSVKFRIEVFYSRAMLVRAPSTTPDDDLNDELVAKFRSECDLFPILEFKNMPLPYQPATDLESDIPVHPEITEWIFRPDYPNPY
jgi:hypothetical protein